MCFIDNATGMTGDDIQNYINRLFRSGSEQALDKNYGIGAKVAAGVRNPEGLTYFSWVDGKGVVANLKYFAENADWGLEPFERPDGTYGVWAPVADSVKPKQIDRHGTMVVLLGKSADHNTMLPPENVTSKTRWLSKYFNLRYFRLPDGVEMRVRLFTSPDPDQWPTVEVNSNPLGAQLNRVTGQEYILNKLASAKGTVRLSGCKAHWWIMPAREDRRDVGHQQHHVGGHIAALYQDEIYDMRIGNDGYSELQRFGVLFAYKRVIIYLEPDPSTVLPDTSRSRLLMDGQRLPYVTWAREFSENMPKAIKALDDEILAKAEKTPRAESIAKRLERIKHLLQPSRYRRSTKGAIPVDPDDLILGGMPESKKDGKVTPIGNGRSGGVASSGRRLAAFISPNDEAQQRATPAVAPLNIPMIEWVSVAAGTREPGFQEDRAAWYLPESRTIFVNRDFRGFADMHRDFLKRHGAVPNAAIKIWHAIEEWVGQQLCEVVIGIEGYAGSQYWLPDSVNAALCPEALTAAVMSRWFVYGQVSRALGSVLRTQDAEQTA